MGRRFDEREDEQDEAPAPSEAQKDYQAICAAVRRGLLWHANNIASMDTASVSLLVGAVETGIQNDVYAAAFDASVAARLDELEKAGYGG